MLKLCRVTKLKVFFPVLVYVSNFDLCEFSAAILEKGLLIVTIYLPFCFNLCICENIYSAVSNKTINYKK